MNNSQPPSSPPKIGIGYDSSRIVACTIEDFEEAYSRVIGRKNNNIMLYS